MKKIIRIIFRYLGMLIAALVIGVSIQSALASRITGNAVPMPFGFGISVVVSGSMEPGLHIGDLIVIKEYKKGEDGPEVNDIAVYQTGTMAVVHRIISIDGNEIITKGDANNAADEPFDRSALIGREIISLPHAGYVALFLRTPIGMLLLILSVVALTEFSLQNEKKQKEEELEAIKAEIRELLDEQEKEQ